MPAPETTGQLALEALRHNAAAFLDNAASAGAGSDPRHVHQARVATRRMRAAVRLFRDVLPPEAAGLDDELTWIASQFGPLRDLDVQVHRLQTSGAQLGLTEALVPYGAWLEEQRQRAQSNLDDALASARFQELAQRLAVLDNWQPNAASDRALLEDAPRRLGRVMKKLRKRGNAIDRTSSAVDLHKVRIRAKRVRYAAEFYEPVYGKAASRLVARSVALQDLLGDLQDGVVSGQRIHEAIRTAAGTWPAETSLALGRIVQHDAQRADDIRRRFRAVYDDVKDRSWMRLASKVAIS